MSITFLNRAPKQRSFGERLAEGIHGAASEGIPAVAEHIQKKDLGKFLSKEIGSPAIQKLVDMGLSPTEAINIYSKLGPIKQHTLVQNELARRLQPRKPLTMEEKEQKFQNLAQQREEQGETLTSENLDSLWNDIELGKDEGSRSEQRENEIPFEQLQMMAYEEPKETVKRLSKESSEHFSKNEPIVDAARTSLQAHKADQARFDRLKTLYTGPNITGGIWAKAAVSDDGSIRIPGVLTPETEEALKITNDFIKNIKGTLGGGVISNFDIKAYLSTLPGLLNTQEGRERLLRDLSIMNEYNMTSERAILDVDRTYGTRISPSDFRRHVDDRVADYTERLINEYVNPSIPYKTLSDEDMVRRIQEAPGNTKDEKIANAQQQALQQEYIVNGYALLED